jgi:hypothetical protein
MACTIIDPFAKISADFALQCIRDDINIQFGNGSRFLSVPSCEVRPITIINLSVCSHAFDCHVTNFSNAGHPEYKLLLL